VSHALIALACVVFIGFVIESAIGFGATLVTVTLGAMLMPIEILLPAFLPLNLVLSSYIAIRHRRHVLIRVLFRRVIPLMAIGLPVGMYLFQTLGSGSLVRIFGAFVVVLAAIELFRDLRAPSNQSPSRGSKVLDAALLVLGGVVHGMFATGGPMVVYVLGRVIEDKSQFRATLSTLWLVLNVVLQVTYIASGRIDGESLGMTATLALPLALGIVVGEKLHHAIPAALFRRAVFVLLLVAGIALTTRT